MVEIKNGQTQTVAQLFAIGQAVLAEAKAKKTRAEIQKDNGVLVADYMKGGCKTLEELSKAILADGQTDPKWKKADGKHIGYQKAIAAGSVGAAGYNSFRAWCAKWYDENLVKKEKPAGAKGAEGEGGDGGEKVAGETVVPVTAVSTEALIEELRKRAEAGDAVASKFFS